MDEQIQDPSWEEGIERGGRKEKDYDLGDSFPISNNRKWLCV